MIRNTGIRIFIVVCLCAVIAVLLTCCTNKKAQIVEREKVIKKQMELARDLKKSCDWLLTHAPRGIDSMRILLNLSSKHLIEEDSLRQIYDSLEMELKKY
jgi:hypothetical protein